MLKRFLKDTSANVGMMFVVSSMALLGGVGLSIDYLGMLEAQGDLQAQIDSTVLAVAQSEITDITELEEFTWKFMLGNGYSPDLPKPTLIIRDDGSIRVEASADYKTSIMGIFGQDEAKVIASAESRIAGNETGLEIALVLDTTDSMDGDKIEALRVAAGNLVNSFAASASDDVKIALVPFGEYVNVDSEGMNNRNASWIDVPADWEETYTYQPRKVKTQGECLGPDETYTYDDDGIIKTGTRGTDCSSTEWENDGPEETRTRDHVWNGCVGSRDLNLHMQDSSYATRIPGLLDERCADPIVPLSTDYDGLVDAINDMRVADSTYMPGGLMWGQRVLSPGVPYTEGSIDPSARKILVLMTDGLNTMKLGDDNEHDNIDMSDPSKAAEANATNLDTAQLCTSIKSANTQIFTIAFQVPDAATKQMLRKCATSNNNYYDAADADALLDAFNGIVTQLTAVRLTK